MAMQDSFQNGSNQIKRKSFSTVFRLWRTRILSCVKYLLFSLLGYLSICIVGLFPINNDFQNEPQGVSIIIISNAVHSEIVLPIEEGGWNWRNLFSDADFLGHIDWATHVSIGWGDQGFFIDTPQWSDLKFTTAAKAILWPSSTCVHVSMTARQYELDYGVEVRLSAAQYQELVQEIFAAFEKDSSGNLVRISGANYDQFDTFYRGTGRYHLFNTCNNWVGRNMKRAGIRVGWFTPLPKSVFLWLPKPN